MKTNYVACTAHNCRKTFRNQNSLAKHLEADHSDSENNSLVGYRCKKCKKVLGTKLCLKEHLYTHTGQKPYKCNEPGCEKIFRQSSQLSYHKKVHFELKRYNKKNPGGLAFGLKMIIDSNCAGPIEEHSKILPSVSKLPPITVPQFDVKLPNLFSL